MRKKMHTLYLFECEDVLAAAFFRTSLDQLLSKHDQPHLLSGSTLRNKASQPSPVKTRKIVRECSCMNSRALLRCARRGWRLSRDPFSKNHFVARMVTTTPIQSATALPKNEPARDLGSEFTYSTSQSANTPAAVRLNACRSQNGGSLRRDAFL